MHENQRYKVLSLISIKHLVLFSCALLAMAPVGSAAGPSGASDRGLRIVIEVELSPNLKTLSGRVMFSGTCQPGTVASFALGAERYSRADQDLSDVNFGWRFPGALSLGGMRILSVTTNGLATLASEEELASGSTLSIPLEGPGPVCEVSIEFETRIPERFGPFGLVDRELTLLGSWYPEVMDWPGLDVRQSGPAAIRVVTHDSGLLVLGDSVAITSAARPFDKVVHWSGPLLLAYRSKWSVLESAGSAVRVASIVGDGKGTERWLWMRQVLEEASSLDMTARIGPLILLETQLREMPALPFSGGVLISDRWGRVPGLFGLRTVHEQGLQWAVTSSTYLEHGSNSYWEALTAGALDRELAAGQGMTPRDWFRTGEFIQAVDQVGTDPQSSFQGVVFALPTLPFEAHTGLAVSATSQRSPWSAARQILLALGPERSTEVLKRAGKTGLLRAVDQLHPGDLALETGSIAPLPQTDLEVVGEDGRWMIRQNGPPADRMLEVRWSDGESVHTEVLRCTLADCPLHIVPGQNVEWLVADPDEREVDRDNGVDDLRRNNRSNLDLKWMLGKFYFSQGTTDTIPTAQFELQIQPRYDLGNAAFVTPFVGPLRSGALAGYRLGLGQKVRPNARSTQVSVGLRLAVDTDDMSQAAYGPMASVLYTNIKSRTNPYDYFLFYGYFFPIVAPDFGEAGLRFGGFASTVLGSAPDLLLAARVFADGSVGWLPEFEGASVGGVDAVRAIGAAGQTSRHRAGGSLELRWMVTRGHYGSILDLAVFEALQLAVFWDGVGVTDSFDDAGFFSDVGLSIRPHILLLGIVPSLVTLDVAWQLPLGSGVSGFSFLLGFAQPL